MIKKILIILGPTATGKTDLSLSLAKKYNSEVISCDSRQVYQGLDIGTGKLPVKFTKIDKKPQVWIIDGIKLWMYDLASPKIQYNVSDYVKDTQLIIADIQARQKLPIIVGGTGLYLKALLQDLPQINIPLDDKLRAELDNLDLNQLQIKLRKISIQKWEQLNNSDKNNPRRLIRTIEIILSKTPQTLSKNNFASKNNILKIGLIAPRENIYQKINSRVFIWFDQGIVEEVLNLFKQGVSLERFKSFGLEYSLIADSIKHPNKYSKSELINLIQTKVRQYAKRQLTWFKTETAVNWFDITKKNYLKVVENRVSDWYNSDDE